MNSSNHQKQFILSEGLTKVMWTLSLPAIAGMVLFGLNAFMDTVYIGQLMNPTALAGVALAYPLTSILLGLGSWAGTGAGNLLSIVLGKEDIDTQQKLLGTSTLFMLLITAIFAIPAYFFAEPLVRMMGGSGEVLAYGVEYLEITLLASPFWVYGLGLNMIVRAEGKMKEAAIMMSYGLFVNLLLTPLFIMTFDMGVGGAAWATNIGMLIYCLTGYVYFRRGKASFPANIHSLSYDVAIFRSIAKLGFPGFILTVMGLVQAIVVFNAIVGVGTEDDLAFFAAANRIQLFLMTPLIGLMRALQPVVGINFGASQGNRVKQAFWVFTRTGFFIVAPFWLVLSLFPESSLHLVLPEVDFQAEQIWHFRVYMLMLPILPVVFMAMTYLPAIEQPKYASIIGMARQLVFYVPVMLLLPRWIGIGGVYYGATIIDIVITVWLIYIVRRTFSSLPRSHGVEKQEAISETTSIPLST
ncbi:MAG: MATE family efflux transporter [Bacteroidota bacterium]